MKMMLSQKKIYRLVTAAALAAASGVYLIARSFAPAYSENRADKTSYLYVSRVIDGDTIKLSNGERVRLIGIDTPEAYYSDKMARDSRRSGEDIKTIEAMGRKASEFTKSLVKGKRVRLEYDVDRYDRYGRTLAYVYLEDGTFVNAKIVEAGYAQVMTIPPNVKHADYFLELQRKARADNRGLWKLKLSSL
jgi:micrococcal nuclease